MKSLFRDTCRRVGAFLKDASGASMVEYALLVALIAVVAIVATSTVGTQVSSKFDTVGNSLSSAGTS